MTSSLIGYTLPKIQDTLKDRGYDIPYYPLVTGLSMALLDLSRDLEQGNTIGLPDGSELTLTFKAKRG